MAGLGDQWIGMVLTREQVAVVTEAEPWRVMNKQNERSGKSQGFRMPLAMLFLRQVSVNCCTSRLNPRGPVQPDAATTDNRSVPDRGVPAHAS